MISLFAIAVTVSATLVNCGTDFVRLPGNVVPVHYNVELSVDVQTGSEKFEGKVQILVNVVKPTDEVVLHSSELDIKDIRLRDLDGVEDVRHPIKATDWKNELLIVKNIGILNVGSYLLEIDFNGTTSDHWRGMYVESYKDKDGTKKYVLSTQLEPANARMVFPCFDEPALKATFNISVIHHSSLKALSNMPLNGDPLPYSPHGEDYVISSFQKTPKMSTYLLMVVVSDLTFRSKGNTSLYARAEAITNLEYILPLANDVVNVLNTCTGIPYTNFIPNITHVVLPIKKTVGSALENWGLISYQERYFTYNPTVDGFLRRSDTAQMVAHELAHQWFGNLVTPSWWKHAWMKEGLATLYQYYALHLAYPKERFMDMYNVESLQDGLTRYTSDPVFIHESQVYNLLHFYPQSTYLKSGGVLNMIRLIIGDQNWQTVMRNYLKTNQFKSTEPKDLYAEIEKVASNELNLPSGSSLEQVFASFFSRIEIVLLRIDRNYSQNQMTISQDNTFYKPSSNSRILPYNYAYDSAHFDHVHPIQWLTTLKETIATNVSDDQWIIFNKRQFAFYRVNYDDRNWQLISRALHFNLSSIDPLNRVQLLDDSYNLYSVHGKLRAELFLDVLTYVRNETDSIPWYKAIRILQNMEDWGQPLYKEFANKLTEQFMRWIISSNSAANMSHLDNYVHATIASTSCWAGNELCHNYAGEKLAQAIATSLSSIHPDWAEVVYCYGFYKSNDANFDWFIEKYSHINNTREEELFLLAFSCAGNTDRRLRQVLVSITLKHKDNPEQFRHAVENFVTVRTRAELAHKYNPSQFQKVIDKFVSILTREHIVGQKQKFLTLLRNDETLIRMIGSDQADKFLQKMDPEIDSIEGRRNFLFLRENATYIPTYAEDVHNYLKRYLQKP